MRKIPTLFRRDPEDMRRVLPEVTPGCEWVLAGEGVARRKVDGTCVTWHDGDWWFRREVKPGQTAPDGWLEVDHAETTGKRVGWELAGPSHGFIKLLREAIDNTFTFGADIPEGTYELCGPKINKNSERLDRHRLIKHDTIEFDEDLSFAHGIDFPYVMSRIIGLGEAGWEGVVWHHPDGRMAKLKARDFR